MLFCHLHHCIQFTEVTPETISNLQNCSELFMNYTSGSDSVHFLGQQVSKQCAAYTFSV